MSTKPECVPLAVDQWGTLAALLRLTVPQQIMLVLWSRSAGYTARELAEILACPLPSVISALVTLQQRQQVRGERTAPPQRKRGPTPKRYRLLEIPPKRYCLAESGL